MWEFIVQYWAEWAFGLLGTAIIAVAIKYKALLDGVCTTVFIRPASTTFSRATSTRAA